MPDATRPTPTANNTESKSFSRYSLIKYTVKNTSDTIQKKFKIFHTNKLKIMPRPKGSPNKITSEVRSKLQYTLPKLKQEVDEVEDLPLFI